MTAKASWPLAGTVPLLGSNDRMGSRPAVRTVPAQQLCSVCCCVWQNDAWEKLLGVLFVDVGQLMNAVWVFQGLAISLREHNMLNPTDLCRLSAASGV